MNESTVLIRRATPEDAPLTGSYLLMAMEDIVHGFIGRKDPMEALQFMQHMAGQPANQYSWQNCLVAELQGRVVGAINVYDGARLHELREPVTSYLKSRFGRDVVPEDETSEGEYYIDTLGVDPSCRGKGIGSMLLREAIQEYVHGRGLTLGILVDKDNAGARQLYLRLGFVVKGHKMLMGKEMEHMQR